MHVMDGQQKRRVKDVSVTDVKDSSLSIQYITASWQIAGFILDRFVVVKSSEEGVVVTETVVESDAKLVASHGVVTRAGIIGKVIPARAVVCRWPQRFDPKQGRLINHAGRDDVPLKWVAHQTCSPVNLPGAVRIVDLADVDRPPQRVNQRLTIRSCLGGRQKIGEVSAQLTRVWNVGELREPLSGTKSLVVAKKVGFFVATVVMG